ncbi:Biorientation of chromosomes in cell division protein 1-like [Papilio xuthus]|uniref:Biorientation of chromosomes in cell division protein 1-like n=1 Tax=Papilio xuthus TaxID=66420 RepID=A0A194PKY9_PAPXU|nr:Biorientation of chromosomes in cell division protein 1-like [Papilio xuthus]
MAHLQYLPGDPRLVDQLVYELKSKGIFDQFRKDCIADVDTRPAYQNLRQRVENSVTTFLSRQCWQPDLNKNQLREKLRKHILDGNYLEQGVERIVDQVVNPKVASVFIPQVEDLVYNYLGITRKKSVNNAETSEDKTELLPTDLEAVSPGSVKSNEDKNEVMEVDSNVPATKNESMDIDDKDKLKPEVKEIKDEEPNTTETKHVDTAKTETQEESGVSELTSPESNSIDKSSIPLPSEEIKLENIPPPENSPPKEVILEKIELPKDYSTDIPLPDEIRKDDKEYFKTINSEDDDSSSDSSLRRNMSPLTPIRNFNNENSCDAQQGFDNDSPDGKNDDKKEPSSFRFTIEGTENCTDAEKPPKKQTDQNLAYQFNNQVNITSFNTPMYEDSSNSNVLQIDYESDANSKVNSEQKVTEADVSEDFKKGQKNEDKKSSHKSSHRSRDSNKHSSSKDRRSDSKHSTSRDSSRHEKKSKDESSKSKSSYKESSRDKTDRKESKESSRHSSHKSSSHKDSKSYKSSSSSQRHSGKDEKRSSSHRDKSDRSSDKSSKDKSRDSKSSRSEKERKSSSKSKHDEKDKDKKEKKDSDDHYSVSGRGNPNRRSTDRDSNDGSSSSKGSHNPSSAKSSESKKDAKSGSSKSDNMSTSSGEGRSPNDRELTLQEKEKEVIDMLQPKPIVRLETHLETPIASPPLSLVPDVQIKKPKFANNLEEAKKLMKMRQYLDEEQKRMNQEAALLLEFQANVRPSLSQIYSSIPGPELEFACVTNTIVHTEQIVLSDVCHQNATFITDQNYPEDEGFSDHVEEDINSTLTVKEVAESIEIINEELNNKAKAHASEDIISKESYKSTMNLIESNSDLNPENIDRNTENSDEYKEIDDDKEKTTYFEVTVIAEEVTDDEVNQPETKMLIEIDENTIEEKVHSEQKNFHYFEESEKKNAELERDRFRKFLKGYTAATTNKIYLINCDPYEESIVQEVLETYGNYEIVNYQRNGHLKLPKSRNIVKNVNLSNEVSLPLDKENNESETKSITESVFSPVKSECSFELSNDYDAKLEEMVNKTSRQEIMEIILGNVIADSPTKMPKIDYLNDSNIEGSCENNFNNNRVLTPSKKRRLSTSDQISSTTEDMDERSNNNLPQPTRSKYLGRARRVGLPRPKNNLPNSPSSDKSVENYEQNSPDTNNGKVKTTPRSKVQRYDTSDLYKPKLHYLSRRNNIT